MIAWWIIGVLVLVGAILCYTHDQAFPPKERFFVQLHVNSHKGIVYSYEAIDAATLPEARRVAGRLRRDNAWASYEQWPLVTIKNNFGETFPETRDCVIQQEDGTYKRYEGR